MIRYRYSYHTIVRYSSNISHHHFLIRCTPREDGNQHIVEQNLNLLSPTHLSEAKDYLGNTIHYGAMMGRHDIFVIASSGIVECSEYRIEDSTPNHIFLHPTATTTCDRSMGHFTDVIATSGSKLEQAIALSAAIYNYMSYTLGVTDSQTLGMESFRLRAGVCQDFAHILIAMCRRRGIYARYVAGFLIGTGETHAWVEVYNQGAWYGIDPTHNTIITSGYIKVAHGRDATDCSVSRGVHRGCVDQNTEVRVILEPLW